jgi:hypothetical protein
MSESKYLQWATKYARAMEAAEPYTRARQKAQHAVMVSNRAEGAKRPCGINGCKRHSYKGRLCRMHWAMVPQGDKMRLMIDSMEAQRRVAERHHRRFLRELQARLPAPASGR